MKAIVIGRHAPDFGQVQVEVVGGPRNIMFPGTADECLPVVQELLAEARREGAAVLFQNLPGQLAAAVMGIVAQYQLGMGYSVNWDTGYPSLHPAPEALPQIGVVVSVPGPRPAGAVKHWDVQGDEAERLVEAIKFANPNAKVAKDEKGVTLTVDAPMAFVYSHIAWLHKG